MAAQSVARYLLDTSAFTRWSHPEVGQRLNELHAAGVLATCSVIDLEVLFSVRSGEEHRLTRERRDITYDLVPLEQPTFNRAVEVQGLLADRGSHRGASLPDLIVAAAAERAGLTVLHYDSDFDLIAGVTGQAVEWIATRGSVN
jgi:predicted nucleic acid-binding protein